MAASIRVVESPADIAIAANSPRPPASRKNPRQTECSLTMPTFTSDQEKVLVDLKALSLSFGFHATIEGKSLGRDIAGLTADMIAARSIDRQAGASGAWPPNSDEPPGKGYRSWKQKKYNVDLANVRTGQMLSIESLLGTTIVDTNRVQMLYGTAQPPSRSSASSYFDPKTDGAITDIEKAFFCSDARPFYELDEEISTAVLERIAQCCEEYIVFRW